MCKEKEQDKGRKKLLQLRCKVLLNEHSTLIVLFQMAVSV